MGTYLMIADLPYGKPPSPEERIAIARRVFQARYGREPSRLLVNPAQAVEGAEAEGRVGRGVVFCLIAPAPPAALVARLERLGATVTHDPIVTHGYTAEWRLSGLGADAWFGTIEGVEEWLTRQEQAKARAA
jgi:hypothetical protein